ncbi:hypothetical protein LNP05_20085 [Klebsiella pneumoniae subsp. pneumoniae]|nr:hypothetical protein [Klebsiella pneumoniae subsp. pneumoniae]
MKKASAIVTNRGGRSLSARRRLSARELGIPAVVGCGDATDRIRRKIRMSPSPAPKAAPAMSDAELLDFSVKSSSVGDMPDLPLKVMMNVGNPGSRVRLRLPAERRRRSGAAGIYHQPYDWRSSARCWSLTTRSRACRTKSAS